MISGAKYAAALLGSILFLTLSASTPALSSDVNAGLSDADRNVFFFGGRFHSGSFYNSLFVFRHDGVVLFDKFRLSPALTAGFSMATDTIASETARAEGVGYEGKLLAYLGPELAVTPLDNPSIEGFLRVQHRSGAFGYIIEGLNGSNAVNLGVRLKF